MQLSRAWPLWMGLCLSCAEADDASFMRMAVRVRTPADASAAVTWSTASVPVRALRLRPCAREDVTTTWPGVDADDTTWPGLAYPRPFTVGLSSDVSMLAPFALRIPLGTWCGLDVLLRGPAVLEGEAADTGAPVSLQIDLPDLTLPFEVSFGDLATEVASDGTGRTRQVVYPVILELGTSFWTFGIAEDLAAGVAVDVGPGDTAHDLLRGALLVGAALYRDVDQDRELSDQERTEQRLSGLVPL